ncbi:MAG: M28 family peptidase [Desulfovibrio sp.]|nr:MAG: M28 family peptidase [Desulfovibrio sp.]
MPGSSHAGPLPALTAEEQATSARLKDHVYMLAQTIGERNHVKYEALVRAAQYVEDQFRDLGFSPAVQDYLIKGRSYSNISAELPGTTFPERLIVVGGHYDSAVGTPGADDNASAVAGVLETARLLKDRPLECTVRFAAFTNEEPPFFMTKNMGSYVYAKQCRRNNEHIEAMLSYEMLGYYRDEPGTQSLPLIVRPFYPSRGDFIAFVGNTGSRKLVRQLVASFRGHTAFPSQGAVLPSLVRGVSLSDHRSFWVNGYPAAMVTDTAFKRNRNYHTPGDTPDTLDYDRMARVVHGMARVVADLAGHETT